MAFATGSGVAEDERRDARSGGLRPQVCDLVAVKAFGYVDWIVEVLVRRFRGSVCDIGLHGWSRTCGLSKRVGAVSGGVVLVG